MSKIKVNIDDVKHVLSHSKDNKVIVTEDGHIFELKSKNFAVDHCRRKNLEWAFADEKGIIAKESEEKAPVGNKDFSTKPAPTKMELVEKATANVTKARTKVDAKQKSFDGAKDEKAKKTASTNLEKALKELESAKNNLEQVENLPDETAGE